MKNKKGYYIQNTYYLLLIGITLISITPLLWICRYNCPSADDYSYAIDTFKVWNETHSIGALLRTAVETSVKYWNQWQGLYISAFLLSLQPAIFGSKWYALTGIIMLVLIIGSTVFFSIYILKHLFKRSILESAAVGFTMSFLIIQYMPSCVEGLYWFNGAVNYSFFFAVLLLYICSLIEFQRSDSALKEIILFLSCIFGVFILEGGNHVTALMGVVVTLAVLLVCCRRNKRKTLGNLILLCIAAAFLYLNISSPGTAIRQAAIEVSIERMGIIQTVFMATAEAIKNVGEWLGFKEIAVGVILLPILLPLTTYIREQFHFKFRYPLVVVIVSVAWLAIMYCPPFYAMSAAGNGRLIDVVYYCFVILLYINVTYILGWIQEIVSEHVTLNTNVFGWKYMVTAVVLAFAVLISTGEKAWGYEAFIELYLGEPQQYSQEYLEREDILLNSSGQDAIVSSYSIKPLVLYFDDISDDANDWKNAAVADFYDVNSVRRQD